MRNEQSPRPRNTGAQNPYESGLRACVDWVQATFKNVSVDDLITHVLALDIEEFRESNGEHGYQKCKRLDNIAIYYEGASNMGIHLKMTGQGCRLYEALSKDKKPWSLLLGMFLDMGANFTRIDGAIDDFQGYFKIDQIVRKIKRGELVSKFKKARSMESIEIKSGESKGMTIYYGSSKSRIQIRMYEKDFERENAGYELEKSVTVWNRTEIQARDERAQKIAEIIAQGDDLGNVISGILKHYLRFVVKGKDKKRSRWKTAPFWEKFLGEVEALKLTEKAPDRTVERTEEWLRKQVAPSLAVLMRAYDGDVGLLHNMIHSGDRRLKNKDYEMIDRFKRQNKTLDQGEIRGRKKSVNNL
jgi:phage replication initiation protein